MAQNVDISLSFESEKYGEINVELDANLCRNGIGSYEFWGQRGFDRGSWELDDYTITNVQPNNAKEEAELWCENHMSEIEETAINKAD